MNHVIGKVQTYKTGPGELYIVFNLSEEMVSTQEQDAKSKDNSSVLSSKTTNFPPVIKQFIKLTRIPASPQSTLVTSTLVLENCQPAKMGQEIAQFWLSNLGLLKLFAAGQNFGDYNLESTNQVKDFREDIAPFLYEDFNTEIDIKHTGFIKSSGNFRGSQEELEIDLAIVDKI